MSIMLFMHEISYLEVFKILWFIADLYIFSFIFTRDNTYYQATSVI
jgi:hypothetical protein